MSIPTDCPQREKNGWTADAHITMDLGLLNFDGITFYEKWLDDMIDNQNEEGRISGIIPSSGWGYDDWIVLYGMLPCLSCQWQFTTTMEIQEASKNYGLYAPNTLPTSQDARTRKEP